MEQRYSIILFILLLFSCAKEDLVEDEIVDNPVIQYEWLTFSERFTDINETTGFFKNQEYFQNYLTKSFIENILNVHSDGDAVYRVFQKNSVITDFDGDLRPDIVAFAQSFSPSKPYSYYQGKFVFLSNYLVSTNVQIIDSDMYFGHAKMEANEFLPSGGVEVLFYSHETKPNMFIENEDYGGFLNRPPQSPTLLYYDNGFKTKKVGIPGDSHGGTSGDIDNDGDIDFIQWPIPGKYDGEPLYYPPTLNINSGTGEYISTNLITDLSDSDEWTATAIELFDVNQDGYLDLIAGWRIGDVKERTWAGQITNTLTGPVLFYGNGTGTFSIANSVTLIENTLTAKGIQAGILGYAFSDYDNDGDIDIFLSTTREEPNGSFDDGTYYDNYHLILYKNEAGVFVDNTQIITENNSNDVPNFYFLRTVDKDNDGDYDLVPDGWANWGEQYYGPNIYWVNQDGIFIKNN